MLATTHAHFVVRLIDSAQLLCSFKLQIEYMFYPQPYNIIIANPNHAKIETKEAKLSIAHHEREKYIISGGSSKFECFFCYAARLVYLFTIKINQILITPFFKIKFR